MDSNLNKWYEWLAYNIIHDVPHADLQNEMIQEGFSMDQITSIFESIFQNPIFGAVRLLKKEKDKGIALSKVLMDLQSLSTDFTKVSRESNLSSERFLKDYYSVNKPVIITDVVNRWPAFSKWDLDFLSNLLGNELVTYQHRKNPAQHKDSFIDYSTEILFKEYINLIKKKNCGDIYLIAHDRILDKKSFQILFCDMTFDKRYLDEDNKSGRVFFWLGPKGSKTPMHRDLGNVFFAQIKGRKTVKLIPSLQYNLVYNESEYYCEVDFDNINYDLFPLLKEVKIAEVTINPGELLFIPVGWWHEVKSLDITITITGNNFVFNNVFNPIFTD